MSITREGIAVTRFRGDAAHTITAADTAFRSGYFTLLKDDDGGQPVEFRNISVSAIPEAACAP